MENKTYDIIGIGIGPFNLGLAALANSIPVLDCIFIDREKNFNWHPGLLLTNATLQVPFYADLVTLADPCSPFSFLAFLKARKKLFRFAIHENNFVTRKEYNEYCGWVCSHLPSLHFGYSCESIQLDESTQLYFVSVRDISGRTEILSAKNIVIGIGSVPKISPRININHPAVLHSGTYLHYKKLLSKLKSITIVGSGQSAAEIFYDLLTDSDKSVELNWFTRSDRFYPMEYSKLSLEMTSPDYINYFYNLPYDKKAATLSKQNLLYKGINFSLINNIYNELYMRQDDKRITRLLTNCDLTSLHSLSDKLQMKFTHKEMKRSFDHFTDAVILATGYHHPVPSFLAPLKDHILWIDNDKYRVNRNYSITKREDIFVQNAEMHTHGFTTPDLGMGPYRNAIILNTILGYEHFISEDKIAFQTFGLP
ncbi:MAG: lysine N(6)-hydroxylase/L-ornithine N(5)-oxygenase family protein [Chitinophagaceae bacterium]